MTVVTEIAQKIKTDRETLIVESDITTKIHNSSLPEKEKENFLKLLSYFTPAEIEELKMILE